MERNLWCGDGSITATLPDDTRILEAPASLPALVDPEGELRRALEAPIGHEPLRSVVGPGSKVTIAFDDLTIPVVPMAEPDFRGFIIPILLEQEEAMTVHGHNERISVENLRLGTQILFETVRRLCL